VRVEACESSKTYVKSIDMTLDARRVPEIDELVALSPGPKVSLLDRAVTSAVGPRPDCPSRQR